MSQWYELVVFTASMEIYGSAVADKLDNSRSILKRRYYRQVRGGSGGRLAGRGSGFEQFPQKGTFWGVSGGVLHDPLCGRWLPVGIVGIGQPSQGPSLLLMPSVALPSSTALWNWAATSRTSPWSTATSPAS